MTIYHIVLPEIWETFKNETEYAAESLATEGFIHCSYRNQLDEVLKRYYKDVRKVLILSIDPECLSAKLTAEASTNNEIYPHIYGKINKSAIAEIEERTIN